MATSNVPEPWASAMERVDCTNPQTGRASLNALAQRAGVHTTTLSNLVSKRTTKPDPATVEKIATALRCPKEIVGSWVGVQWPAKLDDYVPPREANLLDKSERDMVDKLIRTLARHHMGNDPDTLSIPQDQQQRLFSHH